MKILKKGFIALTVLGVAISCVGEDEQRIVAFGDVHGDLEAARGALRLAGAIDEQDRWIGGDLIVVQTGDQLDRGDQEQAILDLFERLRIESEAAGGAFHALLGNHELMNARGDLRYVTDGGFADFMDTVEYEPGDSLKVWDRSSGTFKSAILADFEPHQRARMAALMPGGPYADLLAQRQVIARVGDNIFVHGVCFLSTSRTVSTRSTARRKRGFEERRTFRQCCRVRKAPSGPDCTLMILTPWHAKSSRRP